DFFSLVVIFQQKAIHSIGVLHTEAVEDIHLRMLTDFVKSLNEWSCRCIFTSYDMYVADIPRSHGCRRPIAILPTYLQGLRVIPVGILEVARGQVNVTFFVEYIGQGQVIIF